GRKHPADLDQVFATIPHLPGDQLADMVLFMLYTGCRVGEAREARSQDIDTSGDVWFLRPEWHKTSRHGISRQIPITGVARDLVEARMGRVYLFGVDRGDSPYHRDSVSQAIIRATKKASAKRWSLGQLRHNAATISRDAAGLEATRALLGHTSERMTRHYVHGSDDETATIAAKALDGAIGAA
ncbi:MAG: tyrosine-type recombinase/integrase, partial [Planctomycetota bacterium]